MKKRYSPEWSDVKFLVDLGWFFFFFLLGHFLPFYNRSPRHEELFGHAYLTGRKEL